MVTAAVYPAGKGDGLANFIQAKSVDVVSAQHSYSFRSYHPRDGRRHRIFYALCTPALARETILTMTSSPPVSSAASPEKGSAVPAAALPREKPEQSQKSRQTVSSRWSPQEITLMIGSVALITLGAFESLATTTIMPRVVADLGAQTWFSVASGAALTAQLFAVVIAGSMSDSRGARPVLWAGIASFNVGLVLCTFAPHVAVFVLGRLLQGLGMGLLIVPLYVLIGAIASEQHRPTFFAAFSLAWLVPALIGPAIAGWVFRKCD